MAESTSICSPIQISGLIESWGRGVERIIRACRAAGTPEPEVKYEPSGLWMGFHFLPEHQAAGGATTAEVINGTPVETPATPVETPATPVETPATPVETPAMSVETPAMSVETPAMSVETPVETPAMSVETPDRIVELLRANPYITLAEVAEKIDKTPRTVERVTARLSKEGRLRFVGARKNGYWEVLE